MERLIKPMLEPSLEKTMAYGENQLAYRTERGCRDEMALLVMNWIQAISDRKKIGNLGSINTEA